MPKLRIYSPFVPAPSSGGGPLVIHEQLQALRRAGHELERVSWLREDAPPPGRLRRVLGSVVSDFASPEEYYYPKGLQPRSEAQVDWAIYHYSFAHRWLGNPSKNERRRAVVFHNLESDLFAQRAESARGPSRWIHQRNSAILARHEGELADRADELWFLSPRDREDYLGRHPGLAPERTRVVGPCFAPALRSNRGARFLKQSPHPVLGFVGNLDFLPNERSALWILKELAPKLAARGFRGEILIAGKGGTPALARAAAQIPFARLLGFVPDLEDFWSHLSYMLVPHVQGSGTRIKLLEALASGVPALASHEAGERIVAGLRENPLLSLSDAPEEWARRILTHGPGEERQAHRDDPFPAELDGAEIYSFLKP